MEFVVARGEKWFARDEVPFVVIRADDGMAYVITSEYVWSVYEDVPVDNTDIIVRTPVCVDKKIVKQKRITNYNRFVQDNLQKIAKDNPTLLNKDRMRLVAAMWRTQKSLVAAA
jgi:hypothetical protein